MLNFLIRWASGMSEAQLSKVEAAVPAIARLIRLAAKAQPILAQLEPIIDEATPLVEQAMVEWKTIAPAFEIVVGVVNNDIARGKNAAEAAEAAVNKIKSAFWPH